MDNQKLSAHKDILALNSDYFDRMFTSSFKERDQDNIEINITDVSYETLETLIGYFYNSTLNITELNVQVIKGFIILCTFIYISRSYYYYFHNNSEHFYRIIMLHSYIYYNK